MIVAYSVIPKQKFVFDVKIGYKYVWVVLVQLAKYAIKYYGLLFYMEFHDCIVAMSSFSLNSTKEKVG